MQVGGLIAGIVVVVAPVSRNTLNLA